MRCPVPASRLCTSTTVVAAASPSCAPSSSRPAASPTIMRSKTGRPPRPRPGCLPRSAKKGTRRRISRTRRRSRLPLNASPPSDRPQQLVIVSSHAACPQPCSLVGGPAAAGLPAATPNATLVDIVHRRLDGGADGVFPVTRRSIAFPPCSIVDPQNPRFPRPGFSSLGTVTMDQSAWTAPSTPVVAAICAAEILGLAGFSIVPALLPQFIEAWSLTNTLAGWLAGIPSAGYMLAVIPLVSLTDRRPARQLYLASSVLSALSCFGMALS